MSISKCKCIALLVLSIAVICTSISSCVPPGKLKKLKREMLFLSKQQKLTDSTLRLTKDSLQFSISSSVALVQNIVKLQDSLLGMQTLALENQSFDENNQAIDILTILSIINPEAANQIKQYYKSIPLTFNEDKKVSRFSSVEFMDTLNTHFAKFNYKTIQLSLSKGYVMVDIQTNILFASGKYKLTRQSDLVLKELATVLQLQPNVDFMVEGHADNMKFKTKSLGLKDNLDLSLQRAAVVVRTLTKRYKIDPKRIITAGRGEHLPIADNNSKIGRSENRRIRIVIIPTMGQYLK